jgi:hypothetical protein
MSRTFRAGFAGVLLCAVACAPAAQADDWKGKADLTASPDLMDGDWIQPADIMFVGDSQGLGFFGAQLYRSLATERDAKADRVLKVWALWTCGSDVASWDRGATTYCGIRTCNGAGDCARDHGPFDRPGRVRYAALSRYLGLVRPRVTIVSLGTNMLTSRGFEFRGYYGAYLAEAAKLAGQIQASGSACIWIGPPQTALKTRPLAEYEQFDVDFGRAVTGKGCRYIDSDKLSDRAYVLKGDPEGIHYQGTGEKAWEAKVWQQLEPALRAVLVR